jgi:hypothetical protein
MTEELIRKYLGNVLMKRTPSVWPPWRAPGWLVSLPSGATVKIDQRRIDFGKYRAIENRTNIDECEFTSEVEATMELAQEVWGGIGTYGGAGPEDNATFLRHAESLGVPTGDQGRVLKHFGPGATLRIRRHGWQVTYEDGRRVKVRGGVIEEVTGGAEVFQAALMLIHEIAPDKVVVRGNQELVLSGLQNAAALGIEIIPEVYPEKLYAIIAGSLQVGGVLLALVWLDFWQACLAGWLGGTGLCMVANWLFWRPMQNDARRRGQNLKSKWPSVHGGERKAAIEDARSKGMV